ncbi:hypothetical protein BS47DRAFT_1385996 [Hydnum rufescens UP504]|uniref:Uncharacterized protein n=1 Tax=Hydnum rufescens UP504 TaxID=1448309 RepID=A0A9P6AGG6_9AGAM|nr:hypothetical protein BS47DRAFT_1385996 [Hydnum rufescens UP504]
MSKHDLEPVASGSKRVRFESSDNDDEMDKNVLNYYTIRRLPMNSELDVGDAALLLYSITRHSSGHMKRLDLDDAEALINEDKHLHTTLNSCWAIQKFADVRRVTKFQMPMSSDILQEWEPLPSRDRGRSATHNAWSAPYIGSSHRVLWEKIMEIKTRRLGGWGWYSYVLPVTQSSGTGKSRMIDELSKEHLVIPIVLRDSDGYPPPDIAPRDWFLQASTPERAQKCAIAFLMALFETTKEIIGGIDDLTPSSSSKEVPATISAKFRWFMAHNQTYSSTGNLRQSFYERVVEIGKGLEPNVKLDSGGSTPRYKSKDHDLSDYANTLIASLPEEEKNDDPVFILAFDEAHVLTRIRHHNGMPWSFYSELGRILRSLSWVKVFSVFLSTSSGICRFPPPPEDAPSSRIQQRKLRQSPPFTAVGFDQLAIPIREGEISIEDASSDARIAFLGRPLFGSRYREGSDTIKSTIVSFAREKLVGSKDVLDLQSKLACLAMRIPVQFDSKSDLGAETSAALVERHMRICLDVDPNSSVMTTVSPSEPLLAEAARATMSLCPGFSAVDALVSHLNDSGPDKGNRGSLLAMLLLILAYDNAAKKKTIEVECRPYYQRAESDDVALEDSFSEACIWFNHFVKVHENGVLTRKYLWGLIARGAAVICVDNQMGIDLVIPFIAGDHKLTEENVGVILIQVKNDQNFNEKPLDKLYGGMDPVYLGILPTESNIAVIRMVFALASRDPAVVVRQRERRTTRRKASNFTSYDIWLAKASSQTFGPIEIEEEDQYTLALRLTKTFPHVYHDEAIQDTLRSMNPGSATDKAHWQYIDYDGTLDTVPDKAPKASRKGKGKAKAKGKGKGGGVMT